MARVDDETYHGFDRILGPGGVEPDTLTPKQPSLTEKLHGAYRNSAPPASIPPFDHRGAVARVLGGGKPAKKISS